MHGDNMDNFLPNKELMKDTMGRYLTQSLFLEYQYNTETAIYTLADEHKEYKGVMYPSLRKLYLQMSDPSEYEFANTYLYSWEHWCRICANTALYKDIEAWQEELEIKLRAEAIKKMLALDSNFNAIKWAADGHWNVRRGRPSKKEVERDKSIRQKAVNELEEDGARILPFVNKDAK
jgi:hypothetical protein